MMFGGVKRFSFRDTAQQALSFLLMLSSTLMIWKGLAVLTNTESPIVVVLTGSMEPAFHRGDLLILSLDDGPIRVGDVVVYKLNDRDIPIVHRVLWLHDEEEGMQYLLTKGDNNRENDRVLYNQDQLWLHREDIVGKVNGIVPYVGMVTIGLNEIPGIKYVLVIGLIGFASIGFI
ncbi:hypothetical protein BJ742DRAFT_821373 [Cladochytrium replicatum]|nr:hypothetical protein BJ742DRAFT_821373 [Cladochytrium replicatum]